MLLYILNLSYPLQHLSTMLMDDISSIAQWSVSSRRAGIIHTTNSYNSPIYIPGTVLSPADALASQNFQSIPGMGINGIGTT